MTDDTCPRAAVKTLIKTMHLHRSTVEKMVSNIGINRTAHLILTNIYHSNTPLSQKDLADRLDISPPAITGVASRLEKEGYISRSASDKDSRINELTLTEQGVDIIHTTERLFDSIDSQMFADFSEEELEAYMGFNLRVVENLRKIKPNDDGKENVK